MITPIEQETLDIDWFFTNGEFIAFAASAGGKLPDSVAKSKENLDSLSDYFDSLPYKSEVIINPDLKNIVKSKITEESVGHFDNMGRKGLFAFDKTKMNGFTDPNYHLVISPVVPLKIELYQILKQSLILIQLNNIETVLLRHAL
jgi:hypothetical protein